MAISEDLRSVQATLDALLRTDGEALARENGMELARLLCDNLAALADQVEALEAMPLATELSDFFMPRPGNFAHIPVQ